LAQVDITINGKTYRMACDEGQEQRIIDLGNMVDAHVSDLVQQVGQVGDTRLMVMASLLVADELVDLRDAEQALDDDEDEDFSPSEVEEMALAMEGLAERIEGIADRLDAS
jgi:cell division protein ZapA